jgi:hypothetical protein
MNKVSFRIQASCMVIGIAGCLLATPSAFAGFLTTPGGTAGASILGCVDISSLGISFLGNGSGCPTPGVFTGSGPDTGSYVGLQNNTDGGTIGSFSAPPVPGVLATPIVQYMTFLVNAGTINFDLTQIAPGIGSGACSGANENNVGNTCTPSGSAYTLSQTAANTVSISLSLSGKAYFNSSSTGSNLTTITFNVPNTVPGTISTVLAAINSTAGITDSYSASVVSIGAAPEPGTLTMSIAGILLLGCGLIPKRRFFRKEG